MTKWMTCMWCKGTGSIKINQDDPSAYFKQDKCRHSQCVGGMLRNPWYITKKEMEAASKSFDRMGVAALTAARTMVNLCPEILLPVGVDTITHEQAIKAVQTLNRAKLES